MKVEIEKLDKRIATCINEETYNSFIRACQHNKCKPAKVIRELIVKYIDENDIKGGN